jgi:hypothetical protein
MPVNVDNSRSKMSDTRQSKLQEVFGRDSVSVRRQHEIDAVAFRIKRSI